MRVIPLALVALLGLAPLAQAQQQPYGPNPDSKSLRQHYVEGRLTSPGDLQDRPVELLWDRPGAPGLRGLAGRAAYRRVQGLGQRLQRQLSEPGAARAAPGFPRLPRFC